MNILYILTKYRIQFIWMQVGSYPFPYNGHRLHAERRSKHRQTSASEEVFDNGEYNPSICDWERIGRTPFYCLFSQGQCRKKGDQCKWKVFRDGKCK